MLFISQVNLILGQKHRTYKTSAGVGSDFTPFLYEGGWVSQNTTVVGSYLLVKR